MNESEKAMYLKISNLNELDRIGLQISRLLEAPFNIALNGTLGVGKTALVRSILRGFGVKGGIKSPTYTIVEEYVVRGMYINHFDLYRFIGKYEWVDLGFNEYFTQNSICLIEWAEKADNLIQEIDWNIDIKATDESRIYDITAITNTGKKCLENFKI